MPGDAPRSSRGDDVTNLEGISMQIRLPRAAFATVVFTLVLSAAADPALAMNVCGVGGCATVFTKRVQHPPAGFVRRAVPLTVPKTTAVQPVNASK
jgi:hypothetical protein